MAILIFLAGFFFSLGPLLWIYLPETLNSKGVATGAAVNWLSVIVISLVTPQLQKLNEWMFYIYAILNAVVSVSLISGLFLRAYLGRREQG